MVSRGITKPGWKTRLTEATLLGHQRRTLEGVLDDIDVQNLQTDVTIQSGRDRAGDEGEHVADRLPGVLRNTLVRQSEGVLALHGVDVDAVDEVADDDEALKRQLLAIFSNNNGRGY